MEYVYVIIRVKTWLDPFYKERGDGLQTNVFFCPPSLTIQMKRHNWAIRGHGTALHCDHFWRFFSVNYVDFSQSIQHLKSVKISKPLHTAGLDTIFVQIYMDALPGVPGVSKNQIFFLQIYCLVFALRLPQKGTNFEKSSKLK